MEKTAERKSVGRTAAGSDQAPAACAARTRVQGLELGRACQALVRPGGLLGSAGECRDARRRAVRGAHAGARRGRALGARRIRRGVEVRPAGDRSRDRRHARPCGFFAPRPKWILPMRWAGREIDVLQTYTVLDPDAAWMATGAPQGWAQTLDNLAAELSRMQHARRAACARSSTPSSRSSAPMTRRSNGSTRRFPARPPRANGSAASRANGG